MRPIFVAAVVPVNAYAVADAYVNVPAAAAANVSAYVRAPVLANACVSANASADASANANAGANASAIANVRATVDATVFAYVSANVRATAAAFARVSADAIANAIATAGAPANVFATAAASALVIVSAVVNANAADEVTCSHYGVTVERLINIATGDPDIAQLVRGRAEAYCYVVDFPPLEISIDDAIGTAPASAGTGGHASDWEKRCAAEYRSFRAADGTVLRRGHKTRVRCPL